MLYNKYIKLILAGFVLSSGAALRMTRARFLPSVPTQSWFYKGKHVKVGMDMKVIISDLPDPARTENQSYVRRYKVDYSKTIIEGNPPLIGHPLKKPLEFEDEDEDHLKKVQLEAVISSEEAFSLVEERDADKKPYSSCGRLRMCFTEGDYTGSAVAIGKNLILTAGHNLIQTKLGEAKDVFFQQLIKRTVSKYTMPEKISVSCFVHPKWQESFDSKYDVALLLLSGSLPVERTDKLYMKLAEVEKDDSIKVVHYPSKPYMNESQGKVVDTNEVSVAEMIYHNAKTDFGSSGSPIFDKDSDIIGVHTAKVSIDKKFAYNQGVKIRRDLLEFIDDSIEKFLLDEDVRKARAIKERKEKEDVLRKEGEEKGKIEMILNCHSQNLEVSMIAVLVNMPEEEVVRIIEESKLKESASKKHRSENS